MNSSNLKRCRFGSDCYTIGPKASTSQSFGLSALVLVLTADGLIVAVTVGITFLGATLLAPLVVLVAFDYVVLLPA